MIYTLLAGCPQASFVRLIVSSMAEFLGHIIGGARMGLWIKFDFGSPRSTVVRDRPGHSQPTSQKVNYDEDIGEFKGLIDVYPCTRNQ